MPKKPGTWREPGYDPDKAIQYSHDPFSFTIRKINTTVSVSEFGKVTIRKEVEGSEEYDEVVVPASLIYKTAFQLDATRRTDSVLRDEIKKD